MNNTNDKLLKRLKKFCKTNSIDFKNLTEYQKAQLLIFFREGIAKIGIRPNTIVNYIKYNVEEDRDWLDMYVSAKKLGRGVTLEIMTTRYGKAVGELLWQDYVNKQAITNTFDYKSKKYGMTPEQFEQFNKSRAVTEELCIKRHGELLGTEIWENYINVQRKAGCTVEYFVEKYGDVEGRKKYKEVCAKKAHTYKNYVNMYGEEHAQEKLLQFYEKINASNCSVGYSKISQELFKKLEKRISHLNFERIYYAEKNKEFTSMDGISKKVYMFDFAILDIKLFIEFHGDVYHGNPKIFKPNDFLTGRGVRTKRAKTVWAEDKKKLDFATKLGYKLVVIWESDYKNNKKNTINKLVEFIQNECDRNK